MTGFCSSAFLSVAAGSVSDLFINEEVTTFVNSHSSLQPKTDYLRSISPMAIYTLAPFFGPVLVSEGVPLPQCFIDNRILGTSHWRLHQPACKLEMDIPCAHHLDIRRVCDALLGELRGFKFFFASKRVLQLVRETYAPVLLIAKARR